MKLADLFTDHDKRAAQERHAERLRVVYEQVGWHPEDAQRCSRRDAEVGLYLQAFRGDELERR